MRLRARSCRMKRIFALCLFDVVSTSKKGCSLDVLVTLCSLLMCHRLLPYDEGPRRDGRETGTGLFVASCLDGSRSCVLSSLSKTPRTNWSLTKTFEGFDAVDDDEIQHDAHLSKTNALVMVKIIKSINKIFRYHAYVII